MSDPQNKKPPRGTAEEFGTRFRKQPLIVRLVSAVLTGALAYGLWVVLRSVADSLPTWANALLFAALVIPAIIGLAWERHRHRLIYRAQRQGYSSEALAAFRETGTLSFVPARTRSVWFFMALILGPLLVLGIIIAIIELL